MAYLAQFRLEDTIGALKTAFSEYPDVRVEFVKISTDSDENHNHTIYHWVHGENRHDYAERVMGEADDETVIEPLDERDGGLLASLTTAKSSVLDYITGLDVRMHTAIGGPDGWDIIMSADEFEELSRVHGAFQDEGANMEIEQFMEISDESNTPRQNELTDLQRDTLIEAYHEGYFDDPRRVSQDELAAENDVSSRALSKRMRQGMKKLVEEHLL